MAENNPNDLFVPRTTAPPAMFLNIPERNFQKHITDEVMEKIIGQEIMYYPIDVNSSNFHPLYGESINKTFLPPVRVYVLIQHTDNTTETTNYGIDRKTKITIHFHKKRLTQDQLLEVKEGDFVAWNNEYHEIVKLDESTLLWGNAQERVEVMASCVKARKGTFKE